MLEPHDRRILLDALKPPAGYQLDRAIATTYTLDLLTLLGAHVSFGLHDLVTGPGADSTDETDAIPRNGTGAAALLQAVRAMAGKFAVFCQGGSIKPPKFRTILGYLERSVFEVRAPRGGIFHAKLWIQRFVAMDAEDVRYRVLVPTRNISFDRSWDTMLVLEGELKTDRVNACARNRPLAELVGALPGMAVRAVASPARSLVTRIADELRRVDFDVPEPFDDLAFHPLGLDGRQRDPLKDVRKDRVLVVSPFLEEKRLELLTGNENILVSRAEEIAAMAPAALAPFACHVLHEGAEEEVEDAEPNAPADIVPTSERGVPRPGPRPEANRGLHAKLYVVDDGWNAHVFTGSANATTSAFESNVEILVELTGKRSKVGVEAMLTTGSPTSLQSILSPFTPETQLARASAEEIALDRELRAAQLALGCARWTAKVVPHSGNDADLFDLLLSCGSVELPACIRAMNARPISLGPEQTHPVDRGERGRLATAFTGVSFAALTSFFALDITVESEGLELTSAFAVNATLEGAPADREARMLLNLLHDRAGLLRFLQMLLALSPETIDGGSGEAARGNEEPAPAASGWSDAPLLESLLRALDQDPTRLDEIARMLAELDKAPEGSRLLPEGFREVWTPIWEARRRLGGTSARAGAEER